MAYREALENQIAECGDTNVSLQSIIDDFMSNITVSSGNILQATFFGLVESAAGADVSLAQGAVDVMY